MAEDVAESIRASAPEGTLPLSGIVRLPAAPIVARATHTQLVARLRQQERAKRPTASDIVEEVNTGRR